MCTSHGVVNDLARELVTKSVRKIEWPYFDFILYTYYDCASLQSSIHFVYCTLYDSGSQKEGIMKDVS